MILEIYKFSTNALKDIQKSKTVKTMKSKVYRTANELSSEMILKVTDEADNKTIENNYTVYDYLEIGESRSQNPDNPEELTTSSEFQSEVFTTTTDINAHPKSKPCFQL